jgi:hypothetical protein
MQGNSTASGVGEAWSWGRQRGRFDFRGLAKPAEGGWLGVAVRGFPASCANAAASRWGQAPVRAFTSSASGRIRRPAPAQLLRGRMPGFGQRVPPIRPGLARNYAQRLDRLLEVQENASDRGRISGQGDAPRRAPSEHLADVSGVSPIAAAQVHDSNGSAGS